MYCPKRLLNVSEYPKRKKLSNKVIKNYQNTITQTEKLIKNK